MGESAVIRRVPVAPVLTVSTETLQRAIAILGVEGIRDGDVESRVAALAEDKMVAQRLIDWIPEAFGIVLASHVGKIQLPTTFSARSRSGQWRNFEFSAEPIFGEALKMATDMYHSGDRSVFGNIAQRSSTIDAVNRALDAGESIDGAKLSGPALNGIPAEVYEAKPRPWWRRVLRGPSPA